MTPNSTFAIKSARKVGQNAPCDLLVREGRIAAMAPAEQLDIPSNVPVVDGSGKILFPSLIDAHVHLREPGFEYKEDIRSGLTAAVYGGFGAVMPMANTKPVNDSAAVTSLMMEKARQAFPHGPHIYPVGALSIGLKGEELAPMGELKSAGVSAISNDGRPVSNNELFRRAVEYAATWQLTVIDHCEDPDLSAKCQMNESPTSADIGLKGQPVVGESLQVARDILLSEYLNLPIHLAHISARQSVDLIRWAKSRGVRITAETCPHYLLLDDTMLAGYDTNFKVSPALRSKEDVKAMREAVADGTIDILVTDHAPHATHEKEVPFDEAPCGFIGLETALSLTFGLTRDGILPEAVLEDRWCKCPGKIFNIPVNTFTPGDRADIILFDPDCRWTVSRETIHSKSLNTPWLGHTMQGKVVAHWMSGMQVLEFA